MGSDVKLRNTDSRVAFVTEKKILLTGKDIASEEIRQRLIIYFLEFHNLCNLWEMNIEQAIIQIKTCFFFMNLCSTTRGGSSGSGHKKCKEKVVEKEKMILMKCQRLKPDKTYEEIEIELPVDIFNRMVNQNNKSKDSSSHNNNANLSLSRKLRNIFIR